MLEFCVSLKNKLQCKPNKKHVYDPKTIKHQKGKNNQRTKSGLLDHSNIIQGSKRFLTNSSSLYQESEGSIEISDPIIHEILHDSSIGQICSSGRKDFEGSFRTTRSASTSSWLTNPVDYNEENVSSRTRLLVQMDSDDGPSILICHKCGEKLKNLNDVETHHITEHYSVTELEETSSRKIVETICESGTSFISSELWQIDCILKVHNMPKTFQCFEEYREMVKINANKLQIKNHARCLVDGNELLMFHGTNIACSLGINGSYSLCTLDYCGVCQILRHGFSTNKEFQGALGVYTSSTSGKAFDSIMLSDERAFTRKAVIMCRVIAGRVHCPFEEIQEKIDSGFNSFAEKISDHSNIEELCLLNPKALLPCFVVIYKQK